MKKNIIIILSLLFYISCRIAPVKLEENNKEHPEAVNFEFSTNKDESSVFSVENGELNYAVASWWGFNEEDATECLQNAINSGADVLYIPDMGSPWYVEPIFLESNQKIIFETGCVIMAKEGSFQGGGDALFTIMNKENIIVKGYGAVLEMRKDDYMHSPYSEAQWRHTLQIRGSKNICVYGLELRKSGGDGLYIGAGSRDLEGSINYSKDIIIKDVILDDHYRQGISVISAENLMIENCIIANTYGHSPEAGIDFEPNSKSERLVNCTVRNCRIFKNSGSGIMVYITQFDSTTLPVSIMLDSNIINDNKRSLFIGGMSGNPEGEIIFANNQMDPRIHIVESDSLQISIN